MTQTLRVTQPDSASGFNSAVARTGGLLGTALLGGVLGATGADLIVKSHTAWIACALICIAAAGCSFRLVSIDRPHVAPLLDEVVIREPESVFLC